MKILNKELKKRIIEISYKHKLSHIGSCLTAVDIIDEIYNTKKKDEKFILSSGHAGLALYVVLEKYGGRDAEAIFLHHGVHPDRCSECDIACSTGSLGNGLPIALGMALSDRTKNVYCLISDGECSEGSIWETFRIMEEQDVKNLKIHININGYGAYKQIPIHHFAYSLPISSFITLHYTATNDDQYASPYNRENYALPFLKGLDAHYYVMNDKDYKTAMEILK